MHLSGSLEVGGRVEISGGYSFEPEWLAGRKCVTGTVTASLPGQNNTPAAMVKLDGPISVQNVTGDVLVLELRYVGAEWSSSGVVHVELCDFKPDPQPWPDRRKGKWIESHAQYRVMVA